MQNGNANISTSNYASIMVAVDLGPAAADRVKLAGRLADRFSSHLIGVAAKAILTPMYFETASAPGRVSWSLRRSVRMRSLHKSKSYSAMRSRCEIASSGVK